MSSPRVAAPSSTDVCDVNIMMPKPGPFSTTINAVLGPDLRAQGFDAGVPTPTGMEWSNGDAAVRVSYYPEELPSATVLVSVAPESNDEGHRWVGLWEILPPGTPPREYTTWTFDDDESLRRVLERLRPIIAEQGPRLWTDQGRMATLIATQEADAERRRHEDETESELAVARKLFDQGRYAEARDHFALIGTDLLSAGDRRRLHVARRNASDAGSEE